MYELYVKSDFSSAHNLRGYKGKCEDLHGHNWKVEVFASSEELDKIGMVIDFKEIKMNLNKILDKLDHKYLNDIAYFSAVGGSAPGGKKIHPVRNKYGKNKSRISNGVNPTSENIAKYIFNELEKKIPKLNINKVTVWESDTSAASFTR